MWRPFTRTRFRNRTPRFRMTHFTTIYPQDPQTVDPFLTPAGFQLGDCCWATTTFDALHYMLLRWPHTKQSYTDKSGRCWPTLTARSNRVYSNKRVLLRRALFRARPWTVLLPECTRWNRTTTREICPLNFWDLVVISCIYWSGHFPNLLGSFPRLALYIHMHIYCALVLMCMCI